MVSFRYLGKRPIHSTGRLSIRGIGVHEFMPRSFMARPHGTGDCFFLLVHDAVVIGDTIQAPGTMVFWASGDAQYYGSQAERWSHSWIHCEGSLVEECLEREGIASGTPIQLLNPARIERYLLDLHEELRGGLAPDDRIIENTLENLIQEASRSRNAVGRQSVPQALAQARQTIESRYDERISLTELAAEAHLSTPHFCSEFRRWFGVPPIAYLTRRRLEAAAVLLRSTALDVGEISVRVGFDDPYHFSRQFKKSFGMAPSHFRRDS